MEPGTRVKVPGATATPVTAAVEDTTSVPVVVTTVPPGSVAWTVKVYVPGVVPLSVLMASVEVGFGPLPG